MKSFQFRGLEIHSSRMWQQAQVDRAVAFIQKTGLTALVFNQNDILDSLVYPSKYFPDELMWQRWPPRNMAVQNNRYYINKIIREVTEKKIDFYFEVKELYFPPGLMDVRPELRNPDGSVCPFHPFWIEFLEAKLQELLEEVPDFTGIILSLGTRESMLSISANQCQCERCRNSQEIDWYYNMINIIFKTLDHKGKKLAIRDFSFTGDQQGIMIEAARKCSTEIIMSLKNTPRDYYPTFPTNPHIGLSGLTEWIEFDTWGQFFGIGAFPVSVVEDMQDRMRQCYDKNAQGILLRTDWECLTEGSAFNSMNILNVYAGAMLSQNIDLELDEIYKVWAANGYLSASRPGSHLAAPVPPTKEDAYLNLRDFMKASWRVMEKTNYVRGHLLGESVLPPDTVQKAFNMMVYIHGRDDWEPGASSLVEPTDENIAWVIREKDAALEEVKKLPAILQAETLGFPEPILKEIADMLDLYVYFVKMMRVATIACFHTRKACGTKNHTDIAAAREGIGLLEEFRNDLQARLNGSHYPHYIYFMLNEKRIVSLIKDIEKQLSSLSAMNA